jgi:hypothetical protein
MGILTIHAVEIKLDTVVAQDETIGLYTVSGVSFLRWSEAPLSGVAETWCSDILLKNGIGDIAASGSLERGGNVADYSGLSVSVANAEKLFAALVALGVNLIGLPATITRFEGTAADSDSVARTIDFTGIVEDISWDETTLTINLKNSRYKRNVNLSTTNEEGITTPVCFGTLAPPLTKVVDGVSVTSEDITNIAKFVRTIDTTDEDTYNDTFFTGAVNNIKIFPVTSFYSDEVTIFCETSANVTFTHVHPVDTYAIFVDGDGEGQIRQVISFTPVTGYPTIEFKIKDALLSALSSSGDTRTWVQFVKIGRNYNIDNWPCKSFLKSIDRSEILSPELYSYSDDNYNRIADFGFSVIDTNKNALDVDGSQYSDDIDTLTSFIISPVTSLTLVNSSTLVGWEFGGTFDSSLWQKKVAGIYGDDDWTGNIVASGSISNAANAYDKDSTTFAEYSIAFDVSNTSSLKLIKMVKFGLPAFPENADVKKVYLGIKMTSSSNKSGFFAGSTALGSIIAMFRRFAYSLSSNNVFMNQYMGSVEAGSNNSIEDLPDKYFSDVVSTGSLAFYKTHAAATSPYYLNGYTLFEISECSKEVYNTFIEGGIAFVRNAGAIGSYSDNTKIYELCIIFELNSSSIKKEIYSPLAARIYNDTWGSRKTAANLIENPKDIIEHCKRLQNWSETGETMPVAGWGYAYATSALIKTGTGEGSFDSTALNYLTDQKAAIEITDAAKATTDAIVKELCDTYGLASAIDNEGYERLATLEKISPTESITLADVIGDLGEVIEPQIQNIYCVPIVNYLYNYGSDEFDRTMAIKNITASAWQAAYTPGYLLNDGLDVWTSCKALYAKYRQIEQCPSEFSYKKMIVDYVTALAYVKRKIAWMEKKRLPPITIAYSKGKDYIIYQHVKVQLPYHTNNVSEECIIEKIVKSKNRNKVTLNFVVL